jgi:hypothetical protein
MKNWRIEYSNIFSFGKFTNRISEYIRIFQNYESNTRIYSFGQNSIFVFEYWIFGEQYSNIRIYSNIRPTLFPFHLLQLYEFGSVSSWDCSLSLLILALSFRWADSYLSNGLVKDGFEVFLPFSNLRLKWKIIQKLFR